MKELILNKKSKPCVRAIKTDFTHDIYEKGEMDMSAMFGIKKLYFEGDMNAAPALAGQSMGLINEIKGVEQIINESSSLHEQETSFTQEALSNDQHLEGTQTEISSNGLEEFGVDMDEPDLFNTSRESEQSEPLLLEDEQEEDDLEIPAFLRRQKN